MNQGIQSSSGRSSDLRKPIVTAAEVHGSAASFDSSGTFQIDAPSIPGGRFTVLQNGRVGIGTNAPQDTLHVNGGVRVTNGGIYVTNPNTLVITSPNGACWGITVNNSGALSTFPVTCPQ